VWDDGGYLRFHNVIILPPGLAEKAERERNPLEFLLSLMGGNHNLGPAVIRCGERMVRSLDCGVTEILGRTPA